MVDIQVIEPVESVFEASRDSRRVLVTAFSSPKFRMIIKTFLKLLHMGKLDHNLNINLVLLEREETLFIKRIPNASSIVN